MNAVKLDRWEHHILAARERGQSIKAYALEHGLLPMPSSANQPCRASYGARR
jgi:hypothetical protein